MPPPTPLSNNPIRCLFPYKKLFIEWSAPTLARAFTPSETIDLLSGRHARGGLPQLISALKGEKLEGERRRPKVFHLFYELGYIWQGLRECLQGNEIMGVEIEFTCHRKIKPLPLKKERPRPSLALHHRWSQDHYKKKFEWGKSHLKRGDCYQYNLTSPFHFRVEAPIPLELEDFATLLWMGESSPGAYACLTDFGPYSPFERFFLSNTPECLFQTGFSKKGGHRLETMPIKGTHPLEPGESVRESWQRLSSSLKDENELFMIIDLMRNDLSAITQEFSHIITKKAPLKVHHLLHQYAKIALKTGEKLDLFSIIKVLFPGGSVTGVPKKRVMGILHKLEERPRGLYCGSSILLYRDLQAASLNIRSATYQDPILTYQAGGGITWASDFETEYREMNMKMISFIDLLTPSPGSITW